MCRCKKLKRKVTHGEAHRVVRLRGPDNRLIDGGEFVSLAHQPPFSPREDSWYSFLLEAESTQGHFAAAKITSLEKSSDVIENRTRDLQACNIVPQRTALPRAPKKTELSKKSGRVADNEILAYE
jgi:hypothetical protein